MLKTEAPVIELVKLKELQNGSLLWRKVKQDNHVGYHYSSIFTRCSIFETLNPIHLNLENSLFSRHNQLIILGNRIAKRTSNFLAIYSLEKNIIPKTFQFLFGVWY